MKQEMVVGASVLGLIFLMLVPLSPWMLDLCLSCNMALSVVVLLLTLFCDETLEFSSFPTVLLFLTLFRLGLNIASTRMILGEGEAGAIIATFGRFMAADSTLIGLILFTLLTLINFVVITKGASRIAEVAARFTLEALPGKQMAIDSAVSGSQITQEGARGQREELESATEFYGAMDGASKFIRGDAIAGILITAVNIVGGVLCGLFVHHETLAHCVSRYTLLTIGDGLVTQLPALLVSLAAGILLTRSSKQNLSSTLARELLANSKALFLAACVLFCLALIPGSPRVLLLALSAVLVFLSVKVRGKKNEEAIASLKREEKFERAIVSHPVVVEMGQEKLDIAAPLLEQLQHLREEIAEELGFMLPSVHIKDNLSLDSKCCAIKIKGVCCAFSEGEEHELTALLKHNIIKHAHALITRQDVSRMVASVAQHDAAVVDELIPHKISIGEILKVVQNLLREGLPIVDFVSILESIADCMATDSKPDTEKLTEYVRRALSRQFVAHLLGPDAAVHALTLDPKVEQMILSSYKKGEMGPVVALRPASIAKIDQEIERVLAQAQELGVKPMVVTSVSARRALALLLDKYIPELPVVSFEEVGSVPIQTLGTITTEVLL